MSREYFARVMLPGERDDTTQIIRHYACSGSCNQGRSQCPTPEACEVSEEVSEDDSDPVASAIFWRLYAVAVLLVALMAVLVISSS
jgi:hypothetical protein